MGRSRSVMNANASSSGADLDDAPPGVQAADDPGRGRMRPPDHDVRRFRISEDQLERVAEAEAKE